MDTNYIQLALEEYRSQSGDTRPLDWLPVVILSFIVRRAQEIKDGEARDTN